MALYGQPTPSSSSLAIVSPARSGRRIVAARRPIVTLHTPGDDIYPQWSPDGRYLFYVLTHGRANSSSLWRVDSDGRDRRLLYTDRSSSDMGAIVSPDGRWVLLSMLAGTDEDLWLIRNNGRGLHPLVVGSDDAYSSASAEWSPRGDRLLVIQDRTAVGPPPGLLGPTTMVAFVIRADGHVRPRCRRLRPPPPARWCGRRRARPGL